MERDGKRWRERKREKKDWQTKEITHKEHKQINAVAERKRAGASKKNQHLILA